MARRPAAGPVDRQRSAGGVVTRGEEVLLIAMRRGRWQLPKGHVEPGETAEQAAVREVREETGVTGRPVAALPAIDYWFVEDGRRIHKTVEYFLLDYVSGSPDDYDPREVTGAAWFAGREALARLTFPNERRVTEAALAARAAEAGSGSARTDGERGGRAR